MRCKCHGILRSRTSPDTGIEPIKQWIPADDDEPSYHWQDTLHSNALHWKPKEVPLGEGRIFVLDAIESGKFKQP
jgi:hypothetical protein